MSYKKHGRLRPLPQLPIILLGHLFVNKKRTEEKLRALITGYGNQKDTKYLFSFLSVYGEKERIEREWFAEVREVVFDGVTAYIPEGYDPYLTFLYGDYMTPPPEDKRISHHDAVFISFTEEFKK
jgi:phosphorylcholine metabolism protein LicD